MPPMPPIGILLTIVVSITAILTIHVGLYLYWYSYQHLSVFTGTDTGILPVLYRFSNLFAHL